MSWKNIFFTPEENKPAPQVPPKAPTVYNETLVNKVPETTIPTSSAGVEIPEVARLSSPDYDRFIDVYAVLHMIDDPNTRIKAACATIKKTTQEVSQVIKDEIESIKKFYEKETSNIQARTGSQEKKLHAELNNLDITIQELRSKIKNAEGAKLEIENELDRLRDQATAEQDGLKGKEAKDLERPDNIYRVIITNK